MPHCDLITRALAQLLSVLSHPGRIRIIEELREEERDVSSLQTALGISHSGVSQHLAVLRAHRIVAERREGRHVYYHLCQPQLARWLLDGIELLDPGDQGVRVKKAIATVRSLWSDDKKGTELS